jgi:hypothetical protein
MNDADWVRYYEALGCTASASWAEIRAAYRASIKRWHPDRSGASTHERQLAEERSKSINAAYKALQSYREQHGSLPRPSAPMPSAQPWPAGTGQSPAAPDGPAIEPCDYPHEKRSTHTTMFHRVVLIAALGATVVSLVVSEKESPDNLNLHPSIAVPGATNRPGSQSPDQAFAHQSPHESGPAFTVGSTIGEVYSIQGIPTRTEGDVWFYGESRVFMAQGRVTGWQQSPSHPLRATTQPAPAVPPGVLTRGLTKDEVRAVQGHPTRETTTLWEYGSSRIYFEGDRVSRWEESPLAPLKIRR